MEPSSESGVGGSCLFPSVSNSNKYSNLSDPTPFDTSTDSDLNWLKNESYTKTSEKAYKNLESKIEDEKIRLQDDQQTEQEEQDIDRRVTSSDDDSIRHEKRKKSKKEKKKKKKKSNKKDRKRSLSPEFPSDRKKLKVDNKVIDLAPGKIFVEEIPVEITPCHCFKFDKKPDKHLWTYESLPKKNIARYKHHWKKCLGLEDNQTILRDDMPEKRSSATSRYYGRNERKILNQRSERIVPKKSSLKTELQCSHLPLSSEPATSVKDINNPLGILDSSTTSYVSGKGIEQTVAETTSDLQENYREQIISYNQRLQETPGNVDLWLEFVKFQDKLFDSKGNTYLSFRSDSASSMAAIDKRLSIVEKALDHNPSSLRLKLAQLEIGEVVWEPEKIKKEWDQLLFVNAGNINMWRHYLLRQQCNLSMFKVSKIIALYHKCFKMVIPVQEGKVNTIKKVNDLASDMIELFVQYCRFLHQVGQTEKAVASFQALIEFNTFCPDQFTNLDTDERCKVFESFWDSNMPRIGENGAKGWKNWLEKQNIDNLPSVHNYETSEQLEDEIIRSTASKYESWLTLEMMRESNCWLPWKPDISNDESEDDCKDFERLVLFDDISPVLFKFDDKQALMQIIMALLDVLGLTTSYCVSEVFGIPIPNYHYKSEFLQLWLHDLQQIPAEFGIKMGLNVSINWQPSQVVKDIVSNILKAGSMLFHENLFHQTISTLLWIKLECTKDGDLTFKHLSKGKSKEIRKTLKGFLKNVENRNNLMIWNVYVRAEWTAGKKEEAIKIVQTALAMYGECSGNEESILQMTGLNFLYLTYCELLLDFQSSDFLSKSRNDENSVSSDSLVKVTNALKCSIEHTKYSEDNVQSLSSSEVLRIRKKYFVKINSCFQDLAKDFEEEKCLYLFSCIRCYIMFEYVSTSIENSVSVCDKCIEICDNLLENSFGEVENFVKTLKTRILDIQLSHVIHHMRTSVIPLGLLRTCLQKALEYFPNEPKFLKLFIEVEQKSYISRNLRNYFDNAFKNLTTPIPVLFSLLAEIYRQETLENARKIDGNEAEVPIIIETGISQRIRSVLEKGLQHTSCQHCPLLWRLYIAYEMRMGKHERAKGLFYKALQQCPAVKALYTDGVRLFGDDILQEAVDLMTEKELRLHLPLEELEILINSDPV